MAPSLSTERMLSPELRIRHKTHSAPRDMHHLRNRMSLSQCRLHRRWTMFFITAFKGLSMQQACFVSEQTFPHLPATF